MRNVDWRTLQVSVSPALFVKFQRLIYDESGIWLGPAKAALLCGRLSRRLRALQIRTLAQYYELVTSSGQQWERVLMIDAITTNETQFFREAKHFEYLAQHVFPRWRAEAAEQRREKKIRLWSAGCSSGEEPYSLAMWLACHLPAREGWDAQILATDISTQVLNRAREATYAISKSADIPKPLLHQFMLKGMGTQDGNMKVGREIREMVNFQRLNLDQGPFPATSFDLVFCRNVLIYFDAASKRKVVERLMRCLSRDGLFFTGHAENLNGVTSGLRPCASTIYCRTESHGRIVRNLGGQASRHL
ncbi:MAG TPA: CheR family methyltransferase [Candidatus Angelobacter sp.]|nr:CheR family methyltransferase [Candidatus Angelobacter sp.]